MPTPRPAAVVTSAAVLKPGRKISSSASRSRQRLGGLRPQEALGDGLPAQAPGVEATAVIGDIDDDEGTAMAGAQRHGARRRLVARASLVRRLEAVDDRVLHQVQQRVHDLLDDAGVELDRLARRLDAHALAVPSAPLPGPGG